jgi:phage-related tail protein
VFARIDKAPDELKTQLSTYLNAYGVGDPTKQRSQIALALMKGPQGINELETSLRKANIRTGAALSNINVAEENISQLEKQLSTSGLSTEQIGNLSREAYANIAEVQPTITKLSEIYGDQTPGLSRELEQEAFFGLASQRRKKLQEREKATFGGQAGISTASLAQRTAGAI